MKVNFKIKDIIAISYKDSYLDIHNCFELESLEYSIPLRKLTLQFMRSKGEWVNESELPGFYLTHQDVSYFNATYINLKEHPSDDGCLAFISYHPSSDRTANDEIMVRSMPEENDDIVYSFENGQFIRINCKEIELSPLMLYALSVI